MERLSFHFSAIMLLTRYEMNGPSCRLKFKLLLGKHMVDYNKLDYMGQKNSFEPDSNQWPMDVCHVFANYSPPLYQLSYRRMLTHLCVKHVFILYMMCLLIHFSRACFAHSLFLTEMCTWLCKFLRSLCSNMYSKLTSNLPGCLEASMAE